LISVIFTTGLQLALLYVEPLRQFFGTQALTAGELGLCFGFSMLLVLWVESEKVILRSWKKYRSSQSSSRS
jgi:Ca2+-transporting ATPase